MKLECSRFLLRPLRSAAPLAAALALLALPFLPRTAPAVSVRIASWNILNGLDTSSNAATNETSRNDDWWQVVDSIRRVDPDIVGFTELNNSDFDDLPRLAAELGYPHYAIATNSMNASSYRQGLLSKFAITDATLVTENTVDDTAREIKRWPVHATVLVPGALNPLHVFVVHSHPGTKEKANRLWRAMNAWRMRQYLDDMNARLPEDVEYVVMGDFNEDAYGSIGAGQHESFTYDYYAERLAAGTLFGPWFHLGSDFPWAADTNFSLPYKLYPTDRFGNLAPSADTFRTGLESSHDRTTYPSTGYTLDYILFSDEIMQSAYGAPRCEVYWAANDRSDGSAGLPKPGPWLATLATNSVLAENKQGLDHLMVFGDFHMIDAVAGLTPVAIISEVATVTNHPSANFVEISNTGAAPLDVEGYTLDVHSRDDSSPAFSLSLSGSIPAGGSWWAAPRLDYASNYWAASLASNSLDWHAPDLVSSDLYSLDGRGAVVLRNASGAILDVYGALGVDGAPGKPWNYTDRDATRVPGVTEPVNNWDADEWTLSPLPDSLSAATPGHHHSISEADASVHGLAFSPAAPAANAPFTLSATVLPNALASNLAAYAHVSLNGSAWTNRLPMSSADGHVWTFPSSSLDAAPEAGDLLSCYVEVAFDGPGDLSPVCSAQFDYVFPGLTNGLGKLRTPLFNEVAPSAASPFFELAGPASAGLSGWSVAHCAIDPTNVQCLWTHAFPDGAALPDASAADEWGNPVAFLAVAPTNAFERSSPAALVLFDAQNRVQDAIAWLPSASSPFIEDFLDSTALSTNIAQGLPNYLHVLGAVPSNAAYSLQAPDWVLAGRATNALLNLTQWKTASATPSALNTPQTNGFLRLVRVDRDGDSLLDDEDNCPDSPNPTQADVDGDGLGNDCDPDIDGDGIPNAIDNCPYSFNPEQEDFDGDGTGDVCDDDFDPALLPATESLFVTFDAVTNSYITPYPSSFSESGRDWLFCTNIAAYGSTNGLHIGARSARFRPGGILELDGPLANGLHSIAFFVAPYGTDTNTPPLYLETSSDDQEWTVRQVIPTAASTNLHPVRISGLDIPGPVHFRLRLDTNAPSGKVNVNLDNLRLVSLVSATADVDIVADLVLPFDGQSHTNDFVVTPAGTPYTVSYANADGDVTNAPSAVGVWSATVTVPSSDAVSGGTFHFSSSLVIEEPVGTPEISDPFFMAGATMALLGATVVPNRSSGLPVLFEYGPSTHFGNKVPADESPVSGDAPVEVSVTVSNLLPSTTYHWRVLAGDLASPTFTFNTDALPVPALSVGFLSTNAVWPQWDPVEGATNYVLSLYTLSGSGSGASHCECFTNWTDYSASSSGGGWGSWIGYASSTLRTQVTANGTFLITNTSVSSTGQASSPGSRGCLQISSSGWLQTPPFDDIIRLRFTARTSKNSGALAVQVSTNGGVSFADAASVSLNASTAWKTNAWSAALPSNTVLRLKNSGSRAVYLYDLCVDEATASTAFLPGFPSNVPPSETFLDVDGLAPATTYYLTLLAQGPGWETAVSDVLEATTLASGSTPDPYAAWLAPFGLARDTPDGAPGADFDSDGFSNWDEYIAGTDPTDTASRFLLSLSSFSPASNTVVWTVPGSTDRVYRLVTSSNLVDFKTNSLTADPETGAVSFTNSLLETLFSRLQALLAPPDATE